MFHLFAGTDPTGALINTTSGQSFWGDYQLAGNKEFMPTVKDLIDLINLDSDERFFVEAEYHI